MNKIYKVIYSKVRNCYIVVSDWRKAMIQLMVHAVAADVPAKRPSWQPLS
ncbi:hypothetical protein DW949_12410 [Megasphaera sp. AM44-1BH]|nr:hypothetical protein DW949_12410 [Megasphaera sp. AM44-1BH]